MATKKRGSYVSHPTEGRAYTRSPDAVVPSEIRVSDILSPGGGQEVHNPSSQVDQSEEELTSES